MNIAYQVVGDGPFDRVHVPGWIVAGSGIAFEDRFERGLKGVPGTLRIYAVCDG